MSSAASQVDGHATQLPAVAVPAAPDQLRLWYRALLLAAALLVLLLLDRFTYVLLDKWLLESLGHEEVFWTNFRTGALLFLWGFAGPALGIGAPALLLRLPGGWRRLILTVAVVAGLVGGLLLARQYLVFLQFGGAATFGETDPIFNRDLGFYMFSLPALWVIWTAVTVPLVLGIASSVLCAGLSWRSRRDEGPARPPLRRLVLTPFLLASLAAVGLMGALAFWLGRYELLWKDNYDASIYEGASYVDVVGWLSSLNYYYVSAAVVLAVTALVIYALVVLRREPADAEAAARDRRTLRGVAAAVVALVVADFGFAAGVGLRDNFMVQPNEPVIQLPYIERHIDATLRGYGLDDVETVNFRPNDRNDPLPAAAELLESPTLKNAPLWPGWVSYLERVLDPQHADRPLLTKGDSLVYGPVLDMLRTQEKLRTYYDFLDVDTVRYEVNGEKRMFVSSVRELPLRDPQPWLAWWGQRHLRFTHGHGLVLASTADVVGEGEPIYAAGGVPMTSEVPDLRPDNASIYYGEGASYVMAFSNVEQLGELDYATDEGLVDVVYPPAVEAGVVIDSLLKRIVLGWRAGVSVEVWFSDLINNQTRAHYFRSPLDRIERLAPFLYLDTNPYAVVDGARISWIVNGMTTSDRYPYSFTSLLGDKSSEHAFEPRPDRPVNYVRDAVKITVDAYTGAVALYPIVDEPVVRTWANVYPGLFTEAAAMPPTISGQLQYPRQLMHLQFDNIYYMYHMRDPLVFYNLEDMWDDADEVKGAILGEGDSITFSIEPRNWIAETGGVLPHAADDVQFVNSMVFTNEQALNLRAMPVVYQDGEDYGRLIVLQVPKGQFYWGPEQADSAIDQDPRISEQISWWNRTGADVLRGHTATLLIGREVLYVEPIFIRSKQNPVSQMKRVVVVFRGFAADGATLAEALENALREAEYDTGQQLVQQAADEEPREPEAAGVVPDHQ